jgi:hypothetical protein
MKPIPVRPQAGGRFRSLRDFRTRRLQPAECASCKCPGHDAGRRHGADLCPANTNPSRRRLLRAWPCNGQASPAFNLYSSPPPKIARSSAPRDLAPMRRTVATLAFTAVLASAAASFTGLPAETPAPSGAGSRVPGSPERRLRRRRMPDVRRRVRADGRQRLVRDAGLRPRHELRAGRARGHHGQRPARLDRRTAERPVAVPARCRLPAPAEAVRCPSGHRRDGGRPPAPLLRAPS